MQRRDFLKLALTSSVAGGSWLFGADGQLNQAQALTTSTPKTLLVIFQRGGCDGLNVAVPYGDPNYYQLRPTIGIPEAGAANGALDLDGFFGLHPAMTGMHQLYQQQQLAVFPAVHYPQASRSHFDGQHYIESGAVSRDLDGWLNRHLASSQNSFGMRGVGFGNELQQALRGQVAVSSFRDMDHFDLGMSADAEAQLTSRLGQVYNDRSLGNNPYADLLRKTGQRLLTDLDVTRQLDSENYQPANGAAYPQNLFGSQLKQSAQMIKENVGLEVAMMNLGGWDTHREQGGVDGKQARLLGNLSDGLAALHQDLGEKMQDVMVLVMTEFGRTAKENGSGGTDHGNAACWFAMGGAVQGGVYGEWPGLAEEQLYRGRYLAHNIDFRDIFAEVLTHHLGNGATEYVLPEHEVRMPGFIS